jgi:hypothetical protein
MLAIIERSVAAAIPGGAQKCRRWCLSIDDLRLADERVVPQREELDASGSDLADFTLLGCLWGTEEPRISLLLAEIPLYTAPSHTETWLKRPSGGSRAIRLVCSHVSGGTNRRT